MIRCISKYTSSLGSFLPGDVVAVPQLAAALLADSPGSFEAVAAVEPVATKQPESVSGGDAGHVPDVVSKPARSFRRKG